METGIMENNIKWFILTYKTPLMDGSPIHKELLTLEYTTSVDRVFPGEYYLLMDVGDYIK